MFTVPSVRKLIERGYQCDQICDSISFVPEGIREPSKIARQVKKRIICSELPSHECEFVDASCVDKYPWNMPSKIFMKINHACNNRCIFCYAGGYKEAKRNVPFDETQFHKVDYSRVKFLGVSASCELFCNPDTLKWSAWCLERIPHKEAMQVLTNGTLLKIETLDRHGLTDRVRNIEISIHAATPETYRKVCGTDSFGRVIANVKAIRKELPAARISGRFVRNVHNAHEEEDFQKMCADLGIRPWINAVKRKYETTQEQADALFVDKGDIYERNVV